MQSLVWTLAVALVAVASAPAQITLPGTQPGDVVNWPLLQADPFCIFCHGDYGVDYEPYDTWSGSMMANAARDPLFWAGVDIANQDVPGVGEWCIRCHAPRGWLEGRSSTPDGSDLLGSPAQVGGDFEGIDCHFCHRLYEGPSGTPFLENAQYWIDDGTPVQEPPRRGPYDDAIDAPHPWQYSEYHGSSQLCGVCHNVKNPLVNRVDETGSDTGFLFPEQTTYDEWAQSRFPADDVECQTCHMVSISGYACTDFLPLRDHLARHDLAGANVFMSTVLKNAYGDSLGRSAAFENTINTSLDLLQNQSADIRIHTPIRIDGPGPVSPRVRVTNRAGHKLPTGYPEGRRMWIHVEARDAGGTLIHESGVYDVANAELVADPQLKVYEAIHGVHSEGPGFHLALNNRIYQDNRIPPAGFVPSAETMPVGATYPELADGSLANWDITEYPFTIPPDAQSPVIITASLWYQTASREYIEFLRDENTSGPDPHDEDPQADDRGQKMYDLWLANDKSAPILMGTAVKRIALDRAPPETIAKFPPPAPELRSISANPFRESTRIEFAVPEGARARISVFDVVGRRVRTLYEGDGRAGATTWDGHDGAGRAAASGSYFVRLDVAGYAPLVKRVLLLR